MGEGAEYFGLEGGDMFAIFSSISIIMVTYKIIKNPTSGPGCFWDTPYWTGHAELSPYKRRRAEWRGQCVLRHGQWVAVQSESCRGRVVGMAQECVIE